MQSSDPITLRIAIAALLFWSIVIFAVVRLRKNRARKVVVATSSALAPPSVQSAPAASGARIGPPETLGAELTKLAALRDRNELSEAEFQALKASTMARFN